MYKTQKPIRVLAINPGTRYLGVAVFENQDLIYWKVKTFKKQNTLSFLLKENRKVIKDLIGFYQPDIVAQEMIFYVQAKNSERLRKISGTIKRLVKMKKISFVEYSPIAIRQQICQNNKATKKETVKIILSLYPKLSINSNQDKLYKDIYWGRMLDAVALGLCCWQNYK